MSQPVSPERKWIASAALVAVLPALVAAILTMLLSPVGFRNYTPYTADEVIYFLEARSLANVGFDTGYFGANEVPAPAVFTRFDVHGIAFPALLAPFGAVAGWAYGFAVGLNVLVLACAIAMFVWMARLDMKRMVLVGAFTATYIPLLLFLFFTLQETLHAAGAIAIAALVMRWTRTQHKRGPLVLAACIGLALALVKPSMVLMAWYALVLLALPTTMASRKAITRNVLIATAAWVFIAAIVFAQYRALSGGAYPEFGTRLYQQGADSGIASWLSHVAARAGEFISPGVGDPVEVVQRAQFVVLFFVLLVVMAIRARGVLGQKEMATEPMTHFAFWLLPVLLIGPPVASVLFWDAGSYTEYRVLAPYLLLVVCMLIACATKPKFGAAVALLLALSHLALAVPFSAQFAEYAEWHFQSNDRMLVRADFARRANQFVRYTPGANPYCNTILATDFPYAHPEILELPVGIGVSAAYGKDLLQMPPKSKWVLIHRNSVAEWSRKLRLKHQVNTAIGELHLNLDSVCNQ